MKMNIWKVAMAAVAAAAVLVGCTAKQTPSAPKATLTAGESFVNGSANLSVALSEAASSEVTVTLAVSGTLPEANLTWNPVVKIAAGSKQASVPVTAKTDGLKPGTYAAIFSIKAASGAEVGSPAEASVNLVIEEVVVKTPTVTISSYDESFVEGKASLTLTLSEAAAAAVKVNFSLATEVEDGVVVPADALAFENPATIAAGETSKKIDITLDESKIATGTNWAIISIESAEGANVGTDAIAYIEAEGERKVERIDSWKLSYAGREEATNGTVYDWILVEGWTGEYYDIAIFAEGTLESVENDVTVIMDYRHENFVGNYLGTYTIDDLLRKEATYCNFNILDPGKYEVYLFDYASSGLMTGKWAMSEIEIVEEEASAEYLANFGVYSISAGDAEIAEVVIDHNVNNASYVMYFGEYDAEADKVYYYPSLVDWDAETGGFQINTAMLDEWEHSKYGTVEDWQYGYFYYEKYSENVSITGSYPICQADAPVDGVITFTAGPDLNLSSGMTVKLIGMRLQGNLIDYKDEDGNDGYYIPYLDIPFPAVLTRTGDLPAEEEPAAFAPKAVRRSAVKHQERMALTPLKAHIAAL